MQIGMDLANYLPLLPLLTIQMIFFVASCPVLLYFAKSEEILENKKDKKIEVQPTQINTDDFNVETNMNDE